MLLHGSVLMTQKIAISFYNKPYKCYTILNVLFTLNDLHVFRVKFNYHLKNA